MARLLLVPVLVAAFAALFVRSYSLPPAPDRRGGTVIVLDWPNRPLFGSPRGDCLGLPDSELPIACLIGSVTRSRQGLVLASLPFCATCHDLSQRIAALGRDPEAVAAAQARISRFGW
ncbi:hypothetical protein [Methylobacterium sp. J-090]|uniref:hypothetical protein n=1 Tax=Methylobacterium sp. J-090 TaxID=2836666 RepID=UPI001FBABD56|nr:hypothetical protein [Methylobacterium sp. J-090]MCJ2081084.1 hypothetical protein [Methylobacterium sp. J-090]